MSASDPVLRRSPTDRVLGGVLGGLADFFGLHPGRVRTAYVLLSILSAGFPGLLAYLLLLYVVPEPA